MIKEKLHKGGFGIEGYSLPKYNPAIPNHAVSRKWQKDKIPNMYEIIQKKAGSTPSPGKYVGHDKMQVPRFYAGFSKVKRYFELT